VRLLYIAGSGRSGSTLLDLLLGNHPLISGFGEVHRLSLEPESRKCSCNRTIQDCEYWSRVILAYARKLGVPVGTWYRHAPVGVRRTRTGVRRILPSLMDVAVVVGSHRMVRLVSQVPGMNRKMAVAARNSWKLRVRYEDLCDDTENVLRRICAFIGLDYVPEMIQLKRRTYHQVPGNPMLFDRAHTVIQKDERWRQQLSVRDLSEFARIGGAMNRAYGYCDG